MEDHHFIQKYLLELIVILIGSLVALAKMLGKKIPKEQYATKIEMSNCQTEVMKRIDRGFKDVQHDMDYFRDKLDRLVENNK